MLIAIPIRLMLQIEYGQALAFVNNRDTQRRRQAKRLDEFMVRKCPADIVIIFPYVSLATDTAIAINKQRSRTKDRKRAANPS